MERKIPEKERLTGAHEMTPCCDHSVEHRKGERRQCDCKGYTYITMVGWMCRRENARRDRDKL